MCREGLLALRGRTGGRRCVRDASTFADVIAATTLQFVTQVPDAFIRLGPATRRAWSNDTVAIEFADLVKWRDTIYAEHRSANRD